MKKITLLFGLVIHSICFSQIEKFSMNEKNFTDFVVVQQSGKSANELYQKSLEWISRTYKDPDKVVLAKIENDYIRFEGSKSPFACKKILGSYICEPGRYQVEISFKDGKYKFDVIKIETYSSSDGYNLGGWENFNMDNTSFYYKNGKIRPMYKSYPESFSNNINEIHMSLIDYLDGKNQTSNDW